MADLDSFSTPVAPAGAGLDSFSTPVRAPEKPEGILNTVGRGVKESFQQLPQLGYGVGAGVAAAGETAFGEGGIFTAAKQAAIKGYTDWGDKIAAHARENDSIDTAWDKAKEGDVGALVDWLAHGIGYTGGQAVQILATSGLGFAAGKLTAEGAAKALASGMIKKEAERIGESTAGKEIVAKVGENAAADEIARLATANVAGKIGQTAAIGVNAFGMEAGEIFGDLTQKNKERPLTGEELGRAFGASVAAGGLEFLGDKLELSALTGKGVGSGILGRAGRAAAGAVAVAPAEGATEYGQTLLEEYGKGNEETINPFEVSAATQKQARESAALGALGGGVVGGVGGALSPSPKPKPAIVEAGDVESAVEAFRFSVANPDESRERFAAARLTYKDQAPDEIAANQETLARAVQTTPGFALDDTGAPTLNGAPVKAVAAQELPAHGETDGLSRDAYEAISALNQALGKKTVVFQDDERLPMEGFVNEAANPDTVFVSNRTKVDPAVVAAHETQHLLDGPQFAGFAAVVNEELTERAEAAARERHGADMPADKLAREIRADITGDAWADPTFHGRVLEKMRVQLGDKAAEKTATTFLDSVRELIDRVKAVLTGTTFVTADGKRLATEYVKNLERVHDALAAAVADHFVREGYRPPGADTNTGKILVARALEQQRRKEEAAATPAHLQTPEQKIWANAKPVRVPETASPELKSAILAAQKPMLQRTPEEVKNLRYVEMGIRMSPKKGDRYSRKENGGLRMPEVQQRGAQLEAKIFFGGKGFEGANPNVVKQAYNEARTALGFPAVADWSAPPKYLVRDFDTRFSKGEKFQAPERDLELSRKPERAKIEAARQTNQGTYLNVGLSTRELKGEGTFLHQTEVRKALSAIGVNVIKLTTTSSKTEPTAVVQVDRPLTLQQLDDLSDKLFQQATPQLHNGSGVMGGPMASKWGPFDPGQFFMSNGKTLEKNSKIFKPGSKLGRVVPPTIDSVSGIQSAFDLAGSKRFATGRDFKLAIQERVLAAAKLEGVDLSVDTPAVRDYLRRSMLAEVLGGIRRNPNAIGWYDEKVTKALGVVSVMHPEILTDPESKFAFIWALAVTSNGMKVDKNFELAEKAYSSWKTNGRKSFDHVGEGPTKKKINAGLKLYETQMAEQGYASLSRIMLTKASVKEIAAATGITPSGESAFEILFGAAILGPKIGNGFFMNLNGEFGQLTMDRWWQRMWGRLTGTLVIVDKEAVAKSRKEFADLIAVVNSDPEVRAVVERSLLGRRLSTTGLSQLAEDIRAATGREFVREILYDVMPANPGVTAKLEAILGKAPAGKEYQSVGDELRKAALRFWKVQDGQKEAPTPADRRMMRSVAYQVLDKVRETHPGIIMADLQALLWYPEKKAYEAAGLDETAEEGYEDAEAPDYANAAAKLARKNGISEEQIQQAIREAEDAIATRKRTGRAGRGDSGLPDEESQEAARTGAGEPAQSGGPSRAAGDGGPSRGGVELSPKQVTRTPEFKKWFGDSKVVDKNGEPLVVYHGTRAAFDTFQAGRRSKGFWFAQWAEIANVFATRRVGANVVPVYLSIKNPATQEHFFEVSEKAKTWSEALAVLEAEGYDGAVTGPYGGDRAWVAFRPNQIKSVFNDRPTSSPDISMSRKPGSLDLVGVHYSAEAREALDGSYFGTGMKGAEVERVRKAADPRVKTRVYAYVSTGSGVTPEKHVGGQAHVVQLANVYDADSNPLNLLGADNTAFETAVLDHGFAGYVVRLQNQAVAVVMGDAAKSVPAENKGVGYRGADLPVAPAPVLTEAAKAAKAAQAFMADRSLPSGEMSGENWMRLRPELKLESAKMYYKSDVAKTLHDNRAEVNVPPASTRPANMARKVAGIDMSPKSAAFKAWFGDSVIRDRTSSRQKLEDAPPKPMYVGRRGDFTSFEVGRETTNDGTFGPSTTTRAAVFLSESPEMASDFASGDEGNVVKAYVYATNPLDLTQGLSEEDEAKLSAAGVSIRNIVNVGEKWELFDGEYGKDFVADVRRAGFDAVWFNENRILPGDAERGASGETTATLAVFEPNQIKSVFNDNPTADANISKSPKSPTFKKWFGDSKVVDTNGEPLRVFHGTGGNIRIFDNSQARDGFDKNRTGAYWFSTAPEVASHFAGDQAGQKVAGIQLGHANVLPVYLRVENPYVDENGDYAYGGGATAADIEALKAQGYDGIHWPQANADLPDTTGDGPVKGYYRNRFGQAWADTEGGYPDQWAVFSPDQIKSVFNDNPTSNPDISLSPKSPAFKKWFGDSTIVNPDGSPRVMYHATRNDFKVFNPANPERRLQAIFVTGKPEFANEFSDFGTTAAGAAEGSNIMPVYVRAERVFDYENPADIERFREYLLHRGFKGAAEELPADVATGNWQVIEDDRRVVDYLERNGFDGVYVNELGVKNLAVFSPDQIKSAVGNTGEYSRETADITQSPKPGIWYSEITKQVEASKTSVAPARGWRDAIKGMVNKGTVKAAEVEASGVNEWLDLQQGKVTREQVAAYLAANGVRVEEVVLASRTPGVNDYKWDVFDPRDGRAVETYPTEREAMEAQERLGPQYDWALREEGYTEPVNDPKFSQWQLPGGENYRELALILPRKPAVLRQMKDGSWIAQAEEGSEPFYGATPGEVMERFNRGRGRAGDYTVPSVHSMGPEADVNRLAHVRFNERTDADGKRVLFIEEIQSDWAQQGKKEGFARPRSKLLPVVVYAGHGGGEVGRFATGAEAEAWIAERDPKHELYRYEDDGGREDGKIPSAPFVTKTDAWVALTLKRMIKYAADNGFDRVAWTTGEQQAARYDLSKQIDELLVTKNDDGTYWLDVTLPGGGKRTIGEAIPATKLEEHVGKDMAKTIAEQERKFDVYDAEDLKVGGEGMKGFYDKIVPGVAKDVLRKLGGGQVTEGQVSMPDERPMGGGATMKLDGGRMLSQPGFDITPVLREKVADGVPLFSPKIVGASTRAYTPEQLRMFANTGRTVDEKSFADKVKAMRKDLGKKMAQGLVDQFAPLKELSPMAYMLARLSKGAAGAFEAMLHHGKLKITGGAFDADMSGGFIEKVGVPLHGEMEDFLWWVAANRAESLSAQDRERLFSKSDIAAGKSLANGTLPFDYTMLDGSTTRNRTKAFADSLIKFDGFNKNALDMAEQSGLIDAEARKLWDNEFYVPFYRVSEEDGGFIGAKMKNGLVRQRAFKKLRGGEEKLNADLLANTLANWAHLIDASAKNRAAKAALEAAAQMGVAVEADAATVKAMARSIGKKSSTVWFSDQGVERHFVVDDPFVLTAITSLEFSGLKGPLMDALSTFKHVLTVGVTASPAFKVRNLIRDSLQAIATSDLGYNPVANIKSGIAASDHSTQTYVSALASGGLIRFGTMLEGRASDRVRQLVKQGIKDSTILNSNSKMQAMYDQYIEPAIAAYNEIGNRSEEITRAALYKQLTDKGMDHAQASLMARDLMDFSLQGSWTGIRFLTQVVPFMNARMQGLYKLGRAAGEDPRRFAAVLGATAVFSIALMAAYGDDDDWKKREDWDRNGFWWFKIGGTAFRIPKPFEVGAIATLAERGLEYFVDPEMTGERLGSNVYQLVTNSLSMNPVPQLVKPIVDVYANKDSFTGRPIETMGMEKLQPEYRYTANTSMPARALSTATFGAASPVQIDHMLRGYFGWLGTFVVGAADAAVRPVTSEPTRPSGDMWKTATQNFVSTLPADQSRYVSHMYNQAAELEQAYGTYRALVKQGRREEAQEFFADNKDKIAKYRSVEKVKRSTSALNERIRIIERSNLDPGLKQLQISAIRAQQDRVARLVN